MADWSKPVLTSNYANFLTETNSRDTDLAVQFDPALVTPTNLTTGTIRWVAASNRWEKWSGTAWAALSALYAINISGTSGNVTGTVLPAKGGTGQTSYAVGDLLYASSASALSKLAAVATGNVLLSGGAATAPTWGKVGLTTHVSGILPIANGGTGSSTLVPVFPAGTKLPFAQASAPTGWTQDVSDSADNRMLRVVTTGGGGVAGSHSPILNSVVPAHTHGITTGTVSADHSHSGSTGGHSANHSHAQGGYLRGDVDGRSWGDYDSVGSGVGKTERTTNASGARPYTSPALSDHTHAFSTWGISANHTHSGTTDNGSSQINWQPRYIDMIIAIKN